MTRSFVNSWSNPSPVEDQFEESETEKACSRQDIDKRYAVVVGKLEGSHHLVCRRPDELTILKSFLNR